MAQGRLASLAQDVQGGHRNDLVKTMRGVFRENPKSRMSVRDIGALEAFSAKAWMTGIHLFRWLVSRDVSEPKLPQNPSMKLIETPELRTARTATHTVYFGVSKVFTHQHQGVLLCLSGCELFEWV